ncbi:MAG: zinc-ribbon domain-containing protein [Myxococcales bacterium]|nr:zinc-ribbon domain-containing protein [Myxococcales bacterium]MBL0195225.1 zinc-ribbon domain-containing protein [Myxococcales bacterium]HQY63335.1 zinc-ribbon domain-containing protein [Polyangiaceae bacterium]
MKISCQSCQAKYTIADEKVLGKVVKIRCKKCGATIVINGAEGHAQAAEDVSAGGEMLDYGAGDQWTVNVADGDQRTMTTGELVNEYRNGTVTSETYCWKDGMDGWLPIRDIDALFSAVSAPSISMHPASAGSDFAPVVPAAAAAPLFGGASPNLFAGGGGGESAPAARRERSRNAGADLFGGVAQAGSEDDRMVAAPAKDEPKLTGQRNESSVLFSLASLTKEENGASSGNGGANKSSPQGDASGLIDIRALSSARAERPKSSGVDDIMNLGGGGAFGAALAAPILAPPAMDPAIAAAADASAQPGGGGNKGIIFAIVGGVAFLTVAVVLAIVFTRPTTPTEPVAVKGGAGATGSGAQAMNDPPKDPATAAPAASHAPAAEPSAKEPGAGAVGAAKPVAGGAAPKKSEPAAGGGGAPAPAHEPAPAASAAGKPKSMEQAMCEATGTCAKGGAAAPAAASGAAFDRGAAAAALGGVNVASCKKPDGPSGSGHVTVTFAPNGSVSSAVVDGGPFPGTPVGGCIAGKYRGAHVPAFGGSPVKVGKSFSL